MGAHSPVAASLLEPVISSWLHTQQPAAVPAGFTASVAAQAGATLDGAGALAAAGVDVKEMDIRVLDVGDTSASPATPADGMVAKVGLCGA